MKEIIIEPHDIWDYFQKNKNDLIDLMHEIASNFEFGITIYLTEENDLPRVTVFADDDEVYSEVFISPEDCLKSSKWVYDEYLTENVVGILSGDDEAYNTQIDLEDQIFEREIELDNALISFLDIVCEEDMCTAYYLEPDVLDDVKEHFLEYLARKWGVPIRRPMYLEDEDGKDFFEEYPYEYMIFDDEDNPVYK